MENKVYSQVYSILKTSKEGVLDAIKGLASIGFDGIEAMGTNTGGLSKADFHKFIDDLGIRIISFHSLRDDEDRAFAQEFGAQFTDVRPLDHMVTVDDCKRSAEQMTRMCEHLREFGLTGIVHNHASEFRRATDDPEHTLYDLLLKFTDPALVKFELDVGWAARAGVNTGDLIRAHSGRFPVLHVKECDAVATCDDDLDHFPKKVMQMMQVGTASADDKKFVKGAPMFSPAQIEILCNSRAWNGELGKGIIDWVDVKNAAEAQPGGCAAYISEREFFGYYGHEGNPMDFAKRDYAFLRAL